MPDFAVSIMEAGDREAIRDICCETGYAGEDISPHVDDKKLFADFWTLYYTDYEPGSAFVARVDGKTVGYLTGCLDTNRYNRVLAIKIIPRLILKATLFRYRIGKKSGKYILNMLSQLKKGTVYPPLNRYPAHLHINIREGYRRHGLGEAMMNKYLEYLSNNNIPGVHLGTTSLNTSAIPFYEKMGFELHSRVENNSFEGRTAYSLIYVKTL